MARRALGNVLRPLDVAQLTTDVLTRGGLQHHHVAIVYSCKTGRILANGTNQVVPCGSVHSVHAEVDALARFNARRRGHVFPSKEMQRGICVLSLRVSREGHIRLAKPCRDCECALKRCRFVRRIEWSGECGKILSFKAI